MNPLALKPERVAAIVREVCEIEVQAFKPGNVSFASPGHGMTAELFVCSAAAMAGPLCRPGATVGERILGAVEATRAVAGCNTNLGIVLLLAPLVHAALAAVAEPDLRARLAPVLAGLDRDDARRAYAAIRLAAPGGLGHSAHHDVAAEPQVSLLAAMHEAAAADRIAGEYDNGFAEIFAFGVPLAAEAGQHWDAEEWATVAVFLGWMAVFPDTHIVRKYGSAVAETVRGQAAEIRDAFAAARTPAQALPMLRAFDTLLKNRGINPGTSADLTVASLVALRLQTALDQFANDRPADPAGGLHPPRAHARVFHQPV